MSEIVVSSAIVAALGVAAYMHPTLTLTRTEPSAGGIMPRLGVYHGHSLKAQYTRLKSLTTTLAQSTMTKSVTSPINLTSPPTSITSTSRIQGIKIDLSAGPGQKGIEDNPVICVEYKMFCQVLEDGLKYFNIRKIWV
jgi:hypothetical protein